MGNAMFYHLTRSDRVALLRQLLPRSLSAGWRIELRDRDRAALEAMDEALWQGEGFLPHGLAGGPHDSRQPVLLRAVDEDGEPGPAANAPACVIALGGAALSPAEARSLARVCVVFDGADAGAVERARVQWRALTGAGIAAEYWSEAEGRWECKARAGAAETG